MPKTPIQIAKTAPPPPDLPIYGETNPQKVSFIGQTNYASTLEEKRFIFGIKRSDRRNHLCLLGQKNIGKSKLLELLIRQDIAFNKGLLLLDGRGELVKEILDFIQKEKIEKVAYLDPADNQYPLSFNPFSGVKFKIPFIEDLIETMKIFFGSFWTPRLDHLLRFSFFAILERNDGHFSQVIDLLTNKDFRKQTISQLKNNLIKDFWQNQFPQKWLLKFETELDIVINKLSQFLSFPALGKMFEASENKIDFEDLIKNKKIILIPLSKNKLGEENAAVLTSMFLMSLRLAALNRQSFEENAREDFYVYLDSLENFSFSILKNLLQEAHLGSLALTISQASLSYLPPEVRTAFFNNIDNWIIFRLSIEDAERVEPLLAPVFKSQDLLNLSAKEFYIKMLIDGRLSDPFSARTLKVLKPLKPSFRTQIIELSRKKYSRVV